MSHEHHDGCRHCGLPIPPGIDLDGFCCTGCRAVFRLLHDQELDRYYALRDGNGVPVGDGKEADHHWLQPLVAQLEEGKSRIDLDVQGIHCAGCVWVIERLFERREGAGQIDLNPTLGRAEILVGPDFDLPAFVEEIEAIGYRLGPAGEESRSASDGLLMRVGICMALAGNAMFYAFAHYLGLREGPIFELLGQMSYGAGLLALLVGGSVFFRSAWQGLKRGVLHLDLPIAVGIALAFAGSTWSYFWGGGGAVYIDTVTVFIALMLLGRWLQERVLERNRRRLLSDDGADGLRTRRVIGEEVRLVHCTELEEGDELFIGAGDLVPVDSTLLHEAGSFSLDWIDGESTPRHFNAGDTVPAGAFQVGRRPQRLRAQTDFSHSAVRRLLSRSRKEAAVIPWWSKVAGAYVVGVLGAAGTGLALWYSTHGASRALEVATAILVVTCPCAFGIAAPLAYELAEARLRRSGLFVRTRGFLDRVRLMKRIVFDKTGTLTTGALRLAKPGVLEDLSTGEERILSALSNATSHPKSVAVAEALRSRGGPAPEALPVEEVPGRGVELRIGGHRHRLGAAAWALEGQALEGQAQGNEETASNAEAALATADLIYTIDGNLRANLETEETLRADAPQELDDLSKRFELFVLSGDRQARVTALAEAVGIDADHALGDQDPEAKAAFLAEHDPEHAMMIGDGLNDSLAAVEAGCAGTPAIDRPFLASRCDFYFTTPGLAPIAEAVRTADDLAKTLRVILSFAVAYNVIAVVIAFLGLMQPWLAAILMPASSLATVAYTLWAMRRSEGSARDVKARAATPTAYPVG